QRLRGGGQHHDDLRVGSANGRNAPPKKPPPAKDGVVAHQAARATTEREERPPLVGERPIGPADLVVLTVSVVVTLLGATQFVATGDHRYALRDKKGRHEVSLLARTEGANGGVRGRAFDSAIPAQILIVAVSVVFAVGFVVLLLVRDQVIEREPIVRGDAVAA